MNIARVRPATSPSGRRIGSADDMTTARARALSLFAALTCLVPAACTDLPRGAPLQSQVLRDARSETRTFAVYPVTDRFLHYLANWPAPEMDARDRDGHGWIPRTGGTNASVIAAGDAIDLTVWTSDENALLTTPGQRAVNIEGATVSPGGTIFVPYLGAASVAGSSVETARSGIQRQFEEILPSAQVQLLRTAGRLSSVDVVTGAAQPGRYPLGDGSTTALAVLSEAGGAASGIENPRLRLLRGAQTYTIPLARLYATPSLDTTLRGGDKLVVEPDPRTFVAIGATGSERIIRFPEEEVTALEAIALAGGVDDDRASLNGILVLRDYPAGAVTPEPTRGPDRQRVVFAIDLTSADGTFSANRFLIQSGDVVLATESRVTEIRTITQIVGSTLGLATRVNTF